MYRDQLAEALGERHVPCCSTASAPEVFAGRLTDYLQDMELPNGATCMLCGGPSMVVDTRDLLIARGVAIESSRRFASEHGATAALRQDDR